MCVRVSLPAAEHHRDIEAFWDPNAPPGDIEPLEQWDYAQWGQVGGDANRQGLKQFMRWCSAPRPNRQCWHTELHKAVLSEQERENSKNDKETHTITEQPLYHNKKHNQKRKHRHDIQEHAKKGGAVRELGHEP